MRYGVVAGVAAVRSTLLMGAFRIRALMWMIDAASADLALVVRMAEDIAGRTQAADLELLPTRSALRAWLPDADAFGEPVDSEDFTVRYRL